MSSAPDWAARSGDAWAARWRDTDRALAGLATILDQRVADAAPPRPFAALDVGCGPGSTSLQLALARPDASIVACDLSPALVNIARKRLAGVGSVDVVLGDAQQLASERGPFALIYSRHGVMFFPDPPEAFASLRKAAAPGAALVFSCFQEWNANHWASELAEAAAGLALPPPGREPGGFAFAETAQVRQILEVSGWRDAKAEPVSFPYVAGLGENAVEQALSFLCDIGPASRMVQAMSQAEQAAAIQRMRDVIQSHYDGESVTFEAAAWIWRARAEGEAQ